MKTSVTLIALLTASFVSAQTFEVRNPIENKQRISIPVSNLSCLPGPFGMSQLQIVLHEQVGSPDQKGILTTPFMGLNDRGECNAMIMNLIKYSSDGAIQLETRILNRSVIRLSSSASYACEGAQHEMISIKVGGTMASESIYKTETSLDCPEGIDPYRIRTIDHVIYVLHEDGIPTKSEM